MKSIFKKIKDWYKGEIIPYENDPNSSVVIVGAYVKRPLIAKIISFILDFLRNHWKWVLTTIVAVAVPFGAIKYQKSLSEPVAEKKATPGISIGEIKTSHQSPVIVGDNTSITYSLKDIKESNKPFFDSITEKDCQDPSGKYCDEKVYIINLGSEPIENVMVSKIPLPDNTQVRGLTEVQLRINKPRSKRISILGVGVDNKKILYRERSYSGKNIRIKVLCRIIHDKYEITYEGQPGDLKIKKKTIIN